MKLNFYYLNFVKSKGLLSIVNAPAQIIVTAPGIKKRTSVDRYYDNNEQS